MIYLPSEILEDRQYSCSLISHQIYIINKMILIRCNELIPRAIRLLVIQVEDQQLLKSMKRLEDFQSVRLTSKWTLKMQIKLKEQIKLMLTSRLSLSPEAPSMEQLERSRCHHSKNKWLVMKNRRMDPYHPYIHIEVIGRLA